MGGGIIYMMLGGARYVMAKSLSKYAFQTPCNGLGLSPELALSDL